MTLALNIEKANKMLLSRGVDFPKENTSVSFVKSVTDAKKNVKKIGFHFWTNCPEVKI